MLEAFLADVYGPGRAFDDGVLPWSLIFTSEKFRREVAGITPPNGVRVHVAGIDLIRDEQGKFRVLEDNVRVPCGVSYVLENRLAMTRLFPALFATRRSTRSTSTRRGCWRRCARRRRTASSTRSSWCSPPACTTPPTSSTPCWPG